MKGTCSLHYRHRSKGGILTISLNPSKGDHAAGSLWNGLSTWRSEIGNCVIDVIKATMAQLLWVGLTYINYNTFHSTIVLWRDVFAWHHLVARLGALPEQHSYVLRQWQLFCIPFVRSLFLYWTLIGWRFPRLLCSIILSKTGPRLSDRLGA